MRYINPPSIRLLVSKSIPQALVHITEITNQGLRHISTIIMNMSYSDYNSINRKSTDTNGYLNPVLSLAHLLCLHSKKINMQEHCIGGTRLLVMQFRHSAFMY